MLVYTHSERFPHLHTHTHVNSFPPSCPLHNSPSGCCHCKRGTWDMKKTERCESTAWTLQSYLLLKSFVSPRGCVDVLFLWALFLWICVPKLSAILFICVCACMHFDSIFLFPEKCLSGDRQHAATLLWRCQNFVSSKQSDDILLVIQTPNRADSSSPVFLMERSSEI